MSASDTEPVFALYSEYATEQFEGNYSYDRWGPGVPVPFEEVDELHTQDIDPSLSVRAHLTALAGSSNGLVLLAEDADKLIGFLMASVLPVSVTSSVTEGRIDELYVVPSRRRRGVGSALVAQAVTFLRRHGVSMIRVDFDGGSASASRFWDRQREWDSSVRSYRNYQ